MGSREPYTWLARSYATDTLDACSFFTASWLSMALSMAVRCDVPARSLSVGVASSLARRTFSLPTVQEPREKYLAGALAYSFLGCVRESWQTFDEQGGCCYGN